LFLAGFATVSSDIDCVFSPGPEIASEEALEELPSLLEKKLQEEGFEAKLLSRTRVPIIKMVQEPTEEYPQEIHCDIGFKNHLAIHNTQLLVCYSNCDVRLKQMVLFIKVRLFGDREFTNKCANGVCGQWWAKKRHINSPYRGTLSSYGYVLMILHYLINIVQPPVLPNLQLQRIPEGTDDGQIHHTEGENIYNIWFSKDTKSIRPSLNKSSLGELLRGFFDYYSYKFGWGQSVISIRTEGGLMSKQDKGWIAAKSRPVDTADGTEKWEVKDRYVNNSGAGSNQQVTHIDPL
jgi:DNA polymerase sigma